MRLEANRNRLAFAGNDGPNSSSKMLYTEGRRTTRKNIRRVAKIEKRATYRRLDAAIEKKELGKIPDLLAGIIPLNQEFLEMAINRFAELTRDEGQDHAVSNHGGRYIASVLDGGPLEMHR